MEAVKGYLGVMSKVLVPDYNSAFRWCWRDRVYCF